MFESPKLGMHLLLHTNFLHLNRYKQYQPVFKTMRTSAILPGLRTTTTDAYHSKFSFKQKKCTYIIVYYEYSRANTENQVGQLIISLHLGKEIIKLIYISFILSDIKTFL